MTGLVTSSDDGICDFFDPADEVRAVADPLAMAPGLGDGTRLVKVTASTVNDSKRQNPRRVHFSTILPLPSKIVARINAMRPDSPVLTLQNAQARSFYLQLWELFIHESLCSIIVMGVCSTR